VNFDNALNNSEVETLLAELIRIKSVNPLNRKIKTPSFGEEEIGIFVKNYMKDMGLDVRIQEVFKDRQNKFRKNILGIYLGKDKRRCILWETHLDTVPAWGMKKAFLPRLRQGRMHGRGSCDAKGSLVSMLLALKLLINNHIVPKVSICLAAVVDEEDACRGVKALVKSGFTAEAGIVGEPTNLEIVVAHKGCIRLKIITKGRMSHSSKPEEGINAISNMIKILGLLETELHQCYKKITHLKVGSPTFTIAKIRGGKDANIVPDECEIEIDRRVIPGENPDQVLDQIIRLCHDAQKKDPLLQIEVKDPYLVDPALETSEDHKIVQILKKSITKVIGNAKISGAPYGTDASKLAMGGIPTVVFGPGNISQAHSTNEYVDIMQVIKAAKILALSAIFYS